MNHFDSFTMASYLKILHPSEDIIYDQLYDTYDPHLRLYTIIDSQNTVFSPFGDKSELLVNFNSSLTGFTLEQFPNFLDIVQRVASNYSPSREAILEDTHSHVIFTITPEAITTSLVLSEAQC